MAKRFYYICDPNLPVATKKRHRSSVRRAIIFHLDRGAVRPVGSCRYVTALKHGNVLVAVDLHMAKKLASLSPHFVTIYDVSDFHPESLPALTEEMTSMLSKRPVEPWYPPACQDCGDTVGKVDTVNGDTVTVNLEFADTSHTH